MSPRSTRTLAAWIERSRIVVLVLSVVITGLCGYVASKIGVASDLTNLLPATQASVRNLKVVRDRARPYGTIQIVLESRDAAQNTKAMDSLVAKVSGMGDDVIFSVTRDESVKQGYAWDHRFLFADLADLEAARDALKERIDGAKLDANPLFISLDDDEPKATTSDRIDELEKKLADLEAKAKNPTRRASKDNTLQMVSIQTAFSASDATNANKLMARIHAAIREVNAEVGPGVTYGFTGNIVLGLYEHDSVLEGMTKSLVITVLLVGIALVVYYRSGKIVLAMLWALAVAVAITFAFAKVAIGSLNVMTAFLFAIVIGNGINTALILVARFLEELRTVDDPLEALALSIKDAIPGTLAAAATAAIAYASLLVTDFRGFQQFGMIGGVGMVMSWLSTFTVLPALLLILARRGWIKRSKPPALGEWLAKLTPKRSGRALIVSALITAVSLVIASIYIAHDPFTRDWRDLQSSTPEIEGAQALYPKMDAAMGRRSDLTGQAYQLVFALDRHEDALPLAAYLRSLDKDLPPEKQWIRDVFTIDDLLPPQQPEKLAVLAEIRTMLDSPAVMESLSAEDRAKLSKLRPPDDLRAITDEDVPKELKWPFVERDGHVGRIVILRGSLRLDSFNVDHRREFARHYHELELPVRAVAAGESLIVSDIIETMEADAPKMIVFALLGSALAVLLVIGMRRHGIVTLVCGLAGVVIMIAACAIVKLPVHFLDLIALPITIGIGIDYAVNLAARDRQEGERGPAYLLATTGSTVLLCSYTTSVGYGTLLLSANGGIRAFGLAALLGEVACIGIALIAAPALLAVLRRRDVANRGKP